MVTIQLAIDESGARMKLEWNSTMVLRLAILLSAILLGTVAGSSLLPEATLRYLISPTGLFGARLVFVLGVLVFLYSCLTLIEGAAGRRHQVDRNLLDAFLEHIPDNVFSRILTADSCASAARWPSIVASTILLRL